MQPVKLKIKQTVVIIPTSPFNFDATVFKPAHFPTPDSFWQPGKRWQTALWRRRPLGLIIENKGTIAKPKVHLHVFSQTGLSKEFLENIKQEVIWRFNLHLNSKDFIERFKTDKILGPAIKNLKGMRPMTHGSLYDFLVITIMLQNAPVRRSIQMMQNLFEKYGKLLEFGSKKLYCLWPAEKLAKVPEQDLRKLKVGYRAKNLLRISLPFAKNEIDEMELRQKLPTEQKKILLSLYGVGPQSVSYLMPDIFHNFDFLEHVPLWERKILSKKIFNTGTENPAPEEKLLKFFGKYKPYKQLAMHYIWEDLWWRHKQSPIDWLIKEVRA